MKNIVSIIKTVFITMVISFISLIWWTFYTDGYIGFGGETPSREDRPSMQEVASLLDYVTKGLPLADRNTKRSKDMVRAAVKVYENPTRTTVNRLMQNITSQKIWKEMPTEDSNSQEYCYDQYSLIINKENDDDIVLNKGTVQYLFVHVSWTDSSPCRKAYLERLNFKAF
ncbi:hypothetical protein [Psychrobacter sp. KCTC 72983]|uniref:hypothetical protein n=1 Tax=Psychrobacter TaxID=497 RepID=UPI001646FE6F|nr:hypothetical protein [Psychrobacter sp. KCTC 72983]